MIKLLSEKDFINHPPEAIDELLQDDSIVVIVTKRDESKSVIEVMGNPDNIYIGENRTGRSFISKPFADTYVTSNGEKCCFHRLLLVGTEAEQEETERNIYRLVHDKVRDLIEARKK